MASADVAEAAERDIKGDMNESWGGCSLHLYYIGSITSTLVFLCSSILGSRATFCNFRLISDCRKISEGTLASCGIC